MSAAVLPTPARPFGADTLACALTLTGTTTPTSAELTVVLNQMYPGNTGPTVTALLAAGRLVPAVSDPSRLRQPPLTSAEVDARLTPAGEPDKTRCVETPAPSESKHRADTESESLESLEKANSRHITGMGLPAPTSTIEKEERPALPLFSFFSGGITTILPCATMTPAQLFAVLTSDRYRAQTEALRAAPVGSSERAERKKRLDYVTPAGTFTHRANDALAEPSGLMVLDFDHVPGLAAARAALLTDAELAPELVLLFTSPSGDGLKALVRTDPAATHLDNFHAYVDYLGRTYGPLGLTPDKAGKDVARACFVPYAPDAWLAPAYAHTA